jgi:hypothetical protein
MSMIEVSKYELLLVSGAASEANEVEAAEAPAPTRVKMCEGMCSACGASGAMPAYLRAAGSPCCAIGGAS